MDTRVLGYTKSVDPSPSTISRQTGVRRTVPLNMGWGDQGPGTPSELWQLSFVSDVQESVLDPESGELR